MIVIDTSVFVDFFAPLDMDRHRSVEKFFKEISRRDLLIYQPFLFEIELAGVLSRNFKRSVVMRILRDLKKNILILSEGSLHNKALEIGLKTGCRAIDAYFIATAKITNSILISNDKTMVNNARKYGIKAFYLIEELNKVLEEIKKMRE